MQERKNKLLNFAVHLVLSVWIWPQTLHFIDAIFSLKALELCSITHKVVGLTRHRYLKKKVRIIPAEAEI